MIEKDDLTVQKELLTRRSWLTKGFRTAAALGLGAVALNAFGDFKPWVTSAMEKLTSGALDFTAADTCVLTCAATLGPCYYAANLIRRDITEGKAGLPTRLGFRVVNVDTCEPIQGASLDIWHTDSQGIYSAPISTFCNGSDTNAPNQRFARGIQTTDANGWAYFDTIYPGWYASRVTHIHATIRIGTTSIVTTQFFFADRVSELIYRNHPNYSNRPNRDTTNTTDNVIGGNISRALPYIMTTKLVNNKYLQAVKTIGIRTTATTCNA